MIEKRSRYRQTPVVELPTGQSGAAPPHRVAPDSEAAERVLLHAHRRRSVGPAGCALLPRPATVRADLANALDQLDPFDVIELGVPLPIPPQRQRLLSLP